MKTKTVKRSFQTLAPCLLFLLLFLLLLPQSAYAAPKLNKTSIRLAVPSKYQLKVTGSSSVTYSSSNRSVATVSQTGSVKAVAPGAAIITAKTESAALRCKVVVEKKASSASVSNASANFDQVVNFINRYGTRNKSGNMMISHNWENKAETSISYEGNGKLQFMVMSIVSNSGVVMSMDISKYDKYARFVYMFATLGSNGRSYLAASMTQKQKITKKARLKFTFKYSQSITTAAIRQSIVTGAKETFPYAMAFFDLYLYYATGLRLRQIGFVNYK